MLALSPDGRHLYTGGVNGHAVLTRKRAAGTLRPSSCVTWRRRARCARAPGLEMVNDIAVSPDGRHVYAASGGWIEGVEGDYPIDGSDAVTAFARRPRTGALRAVNCLQSAARFRSKEDDARERGCGAGRALAGATSIAISPDGRSVYTAGWWTSGVAVLRRDRRTGALSQPRGQAGCVRLQRAEGCAVAPVGDARDLVVSPDGRHVYVRSGDRIVVFARDRTGRLRHRGATPAERADTLAIAPDGRHVYTGEAGLARDAGTGALTPLPGTPVWHPAVGFVRDMQIGEATATLVSDGDVALLARDQATGALNLMASAPACGLGRRSRPFCMGDRESGTPEAVAAVDGCLHVAVGDGVHVLLAGAR
jgi:sugar lactone lactonase YvrE